MTAAMLVLGPIYEVDLPPEQYAYRPGRNAQQAAVEVHEVLFRGRPEVVDVDFADSCGIWPRALGLLLRLGDDHPHLKAEGGQDFLRGSHRRISPFGFYVP